MIGSLWDLKQGVVVAKRGKFYYHDRFPMGFETYPSSRMYKKERSIMIGSLWDLKHTALSTIFSGGGTIMIGSLWDLKRSKDCRRWGVLGLS